MKLSTKGRYAMVAMADLAMLPEGKLSALSDLSKRQNISLPYLEQLFVKLRRAGLVTSVRGPGGGYCLARAASDIRVVEVFAAVDETVDAMHKGASATGAQSGSRAQSMTNRLWERLSAHVYVYPAPDAPVGRGEERPDALPGRADALRGGGRGVIPSGRSRPSATGVAVRIFER
jgi:Rrf2 family iron-sulfur cluster assembly transcriptional regulator